MASKNPESMEGCEDAGAKEIPAFHHPGTRQDEIFLQYTTPEEMKQLPATQIPWQTVRYGAPETGEHGIVIPIFVKKSELRSKGYKIISLIPHEDNN